MNLAFDLASIQTTEFGAGRKENGNDRFLLVPVDNSVQTALHEMVEATWRDMHQDHEEPEQYQPSEKHKRKEHLIISTDSPLCRQLVEVHNANNLQIDAGAVNDPDRISSYFVRMTDGGGRRLTAMRQARYFKGDLRKKLIHLLDDTLRILESRVFRLDSDFDLIIDTDYVHIWRPSAFEFLGNLKQAILDAVPYNVGVIRRDLPFLEFDGIQEYAATRPRAAKYLASIRTQNLAGINRAALEAFCQKTGVDILSVNGQISVEKSNIMGLLEVLDRRRYEINLVPDDPERFRATGRRRIDT